MYHGDILDSAQSTWSRTKVRVTHDDKSRELTLVMYENLHSTIRVFALQAIRTRIQGNFDIWYRSKLKDLDRRSKERKRFRERANKDHDRKRWDNKDQDEDEERDFFNYLTNRYNKKEYSKQSSLLQPSSYASETMACYYYDR